MKLNIYEQIFLKENIKIVYVKCFDFILAEMVIIKFLDINF